MAVFDIVRALWRRVWRLGRPAARSPQPVIIDLDTRLEVLKCAGSFTSDPTSAILIAENARPLLAWLSEADSAEDLNARVYALRGYQLLPADDDEDAGVEDNPLEFLTRAGVFYRFLAGTAEAEAAPMLDTADEKLHAWMDGDLDA